MKKIVSIVSLFIISLFSAQNVGVGTDTPHASAALDIHSDHQGALLTRVNLLHSKDVTTIANPAPGLFVYNLQDTPAGTVLPSGAANVLKNTFYYWNGTSWTENATIDVARTILIPMAFEISQNDQQITSNNDGTPGLINGNDLVVNFDDDSSNPNLKVVINDFIDQGSSIRLIDLTNNVFTVNYPGSNKFEISGYINYNPYAKVAPIDVEFVIQKLNGTVWTDLSKSDMVFGGSTRGNSRTINIAPRIVTLNEGDKIRGVVRKLLPNNHGGVNNTFSRIYVPTGMNFSKALRILLIN